MLERVEQAAKRPPAVLTKVINSPAVGKTPPASGLLGTHATKIARADEALAKWAIQAGVAWAAIDSRHPAFKDVVNAILAVGPTFTLARREDLSRSDERQDMIVHVQVHTIA